MKLKKIISLMTASLLTIGLVTGCSNKGTEKQDLWMVWKT